MHNRCRSSPRILGLLLALALAASCGAQNPPQPLPMGMIGAADLSPQQLDQVKAYVSHFGAVLGQSDDPAEVESARAALIAPMNQPNASRLVSPVFRLEYSKAATPEMEKVLNGGDLHRSVNALLVLSQLGESRAADLVLEQTSPSKPWQIRLQAASALRVLLQGAALDPKKAPQVAKRVRDAAAREDNGLVLAHYLAALDAAAETIPAEQDKQAVRGFLVDAMAGIGERLAQQNAYAGATLAAFVKELERFRQRYAQLPGAEQAELGKRLAPALVNVLAHMLQHWDSARAGNEPVETLVGACETSLQIVNTFVKAPPPPPIDLRGAWSEGDKAKFEEGVNAWRAQLAKAPYT
jgi:hypothetical protein